MDYTKQDPNLVKPAAYDDATFSTEITSVSTVTVNGTQNVVNKIKYEIWAEVEGQRTAHLGEVVYSPEQLNEQGSFVPYESLTKAQVVEWVENYIHLQSIHYSLCNRFVQKPVEVSPLLPWLNFQTQGA